jgi:hypothetical protein
MSEEITKGRSLILWVRYDFLIAEKSRYIVEEMPLSFRDGSVTLVTISSFLFCLVFREVKAMLVVEKRHYGFFNFIGDCIMVFLTFGLWLIYIFVREMRHKTRIYGYFE